MRVQATSKDRKTGLHEGVRSITLSVPKDYPKEALEFWAPMLATMHTWICNSARFKNGLAAEMVAFDKWAKRRTRPYAKLIKEHYAMKKEDVTSDTRDFD